MTIFYGFYKWKANYYHDMFILQQDFDLSTKANSIKFAIYEHTINGKA